MAFRPCPNCEKQVASLAVKCPYCGASMEQMGPGQLMFIILMIITVIAILGLFFLHLNPYPDRPN